MLPDNYEQFNTHSGENVRDDDIYINLALIKFSKLYVQRDLLMLEKI
jgi:hypothetical protein